MILILKMLVRLSLSLVFLSALNLSAFAQSSTRTAVETRQAQISTIAKSLDNGDINIVEARDALRLIRTEARTSNDALVKEEADLKSQLDSLGAIPEDKNSEPLEVSSRRKDLNKDLTEVTSLIAQAKLNIADAGRLLDGLSQTQRSSFLSETFKLEQSSFSPAKWRTVGQSLEAETGKFSTHFKQTKAARVELGQWRGDKIRAVGMFILMALFLLPLRLWIKRLFSARLNRAIPRDAGRYVALVLHITMRVVPAAIGLLVICQAVLKIGLVTPEYAITLRVVSCAILTALLADGFALGLFNPSKSIWRIIPLQDRAAKSARRLSVSAIIVLGLGGAITSLSTLRPEVMPLSNLATVITALGVCVLAFMAIILTKWALIDDRKDDISEATRKRWKLIRKAGLPLIVIVLAALSLGYMNFAYFVSVRMVLLIGVFLWVWVIRRYAIHTLNEFDQKVMAKQAAAKSTSRQAMLFWTGLVLDGLILLALIPIVLLIFGVDGYSVRTGLLDAFTGITIGNFTLSIADILAGIATFFIILFVTRFLQRALDMRLFEKSGADIGFRNSFRTLLGYAGLITAIFAAIGVIGLDLSNLAIIAGALSVGIGFGLQSIVNNFVSGLILLFERPVKVGDWVVTTSGEGVVKQISVRSTEIETFDRASIIVPNSELISSSVTNWTHKNKMGRVTIPIGIAYGSDAKHVREILMDIAHKNPKVLKTPEPFVYFKGFGDSSLDLELRVFVKIISEGPIVKNDLRFEILDVFRAEKIEIPFPQRDVHMSK